jgi:ketol-acid reductoisomerase
MDRSGGDIGGRVAGQHGRLIRPRGRMAVIGYGSQGRAQASVLQRAGLDVCVGLPAKSRSRRRAEADGFEVCDVGDAATGVRSIALLGPDTQNAGIAAGIEPSLMPGALVVLAHGYALQFGGWVPREDIDVVVVAPNAPGPHLEGASSGGKSVSCFVAVANDATGRAERRARGYARTISADGDGVIPTTVKQETIGDLFGEQAVLCGGLWSLVRAGFDTLVSHGFTARHAEVEVLGQLHHLVRLLQQSGSSGFLRTISAAASFGAVESADRFDAAHRSICESIFDEVESGRFASRLEDAVGSRVESWREAWDDHPLARSKPR